MCRVFFAIYVVQFCQKSCRATAVPQIISKDIFNKVQVKMSKRKQTRKHSRAIENYLLTTKMVCGICGGAYVGARRRRGDKSGSMWVAYGCNMRYRNRSVECNNKEISKLYIEGIVLEKLSEYVFSDNYIPMITSEYNKYLLGKNSEYICQVKNYQSQLKKINADIEKLVDMLMKTSSQVLFDKLSNSEKEKMQIESKLKLLISENRKDKFTEDDIKIVFDKIRKQLVIGNLKNVKQVIDTYVDKIIVFPEEVTVKLNFFPDFSLELDEKNAEKNCPITEGVLDLQGQFNSSTQQNADDCGGEGGI
ncbi:MAG: zinc ribbon domain-containing protein [Oscillospiraceae bacterium]